MKALSTLFTLALVLTVSIEANAQHYCGFDPFMEHTHSHPSDIEARHATNVRILEQMHQLTSEMRSDEYVIPVVVHVIIELVYDAVITEFGLGINLTPTGKIFISNQASTAGSEKYLIPMHLQTRSSTTPTAFLRRPSSTVSKTTTTDMCMDRHCFSKEKPKYVQAAPTRTMFSVLTASRHR